MAAEGADFTNRYSQASCTASSASFITGRIPIRSALSVTNPVIPTTGTPKHQR
jgi:arylsulfatase